MWPAKSRVGLGSAPARQIFRLLASSEPQRSLHGRGEILLDSLSLDLPAEKIRPQKLAERGRVLRETTRPRQFAGEAAERIVLQMHDSLRNVRKIPPAATWVEGINHVFVIKYAPKRAGLERAEVEHDGDKHVPQSLLVQGQRKMMMVNDVVTFFRPQDQPHHHRSCRLRPSTSIRVDCRGPWCPT